MLAWAIPETCLVSVCAQGRNCDDLLNDLLHWLVRNLRCVLCNLPCLMDTWGLHHFLDRDRHESVTSLNDGVVRDTLQWNDLRGMNALLTELLNWLVHDLRCFLKCYLCDLPCSMVRHLELLMDTWSLHNSLDRHWYKHVTKPIDDAVKDTLLWSNLRGLNGLFSDLLHWLVLNWHVHGQMMHHSLDRQWNSLWDKNDLLNDLLHRVVHQQRYFLCRMPSLLDTWGMHHFFNRDWHGSVSSLNDGAVRDTPLRGKHRDLNDLLSNLLHWDMDGLLDDLLHRLVHYQGCFLHHFLDSHRYKHVNTLFDGAVI